MDISENTDDLCRWINVIKDILIRWTFMEYMDFAKTFLENKLLKCFCILKPAIVILCDFVKFLVKYLKFC
jgi:hypothetical protein